MMYHPDHVCLGSFRTEEYYCDMMEEASYDRGQHPHHLWEVGVISLEQCEKEEAAIKAGIFKQCMLAATPKWLWINILSPYEQPDLPF
jgi:hypothetical protein